MAPAYQIRQTNLKAHTGDMWFRGENPANGALIDYWIGTPGIAPTVTVHTLERSTGQHAARHRQSRRQSHRLEPA